MEPRVSLITFGVRDLKRAREFYERLGWQGQLLEETVFIRLGACALILWDREKLADDSGLAAADVAGAEATFSAVVLAHNVRTPREVDEILAVAHAAGGTITRPAQQTFYGGYAGYFADPDGHLWEIAHNPGLPLADDGSIIIPEFGTDDH